MLTQDLFHVKTFDRLEFIVEAANIGGPEEGDVDDAKIDQTVGNRVLVAVRGHDGFVPSCVSCGFP